MILAAKFYKQKCLPVCWIVTRDEIDWLFSKKNLNSGKGKLVQVENDIKCLPVWRQCMYDNNNLADFTPGNSSEQNF